MGSSESDDEQEEEEEEDNEGEAGREEEEEDDKRRLSGKTPFRSVSSKKPYERELRSRKMLRKDTCVVLFLFVVVL